MSMMIMFMLYLREYMIVPPKRQRDFHFGVWWDNVYSGVQLC